MRQLLSKRKTAALARSTGLPVVAVLVRGGTEHRRDLCLADGTVVHLFRDGTLIRSELHHSYTAQDGAA